MKKPLTVKQQKIYSFISQYIKDNDKSPTMEEMRRFLGAKSINTVSDYLKALERKGYIYRCKYAKRGIELPGNTNSTTTWTRVIPVCASVGCDDLSMFGADEHDEFINVDEQLIGQRKNMVAVRAVGNSMNDADIHDGDYILLELTQEADNGDLVAAIIGNMVTVKKYERKNGLVVLRPQSNDPKYRPIVVREDFKIAGKVTYVIPGSSLDITEVVPIKESGSV